MVGVTKFLCVGGDFPNILTKKPSPRGGRSFSYFATTFSFPNIPSSLVSTKGVALILRLDA